jgi:NitT/TauT family transport system substrate-binding protein
MGVRLGRFVASCGILTALAAVAVVPMAHAQKYGKVGDPVHLVVGYQPFYTEAWSALILKNKELWKAHLPPGSTVTFEPAPQGSVIVGALHGDKQQIGYMGDMPALVSVSRPEIADVRLVATAGISKQQCNILLVRSDAPAFGNGKEAGKWLDGKAVGAPGGSCSDRFARAVFAKSGIKPGKYFNHTADQLKEGFTDKSLDAAVVWEPAASRLVAEGLAKRAATGDDFGEGDAALVAMRNDLIEERPDVVKGWLKAEMEAQRFLADKANAGAVIAIAEKEAPGFPATVLKSALYGEGGAPKVTFEYAITPKVQEMITASVAFLHEQKRLPQPTLRPEAIAGKIAAELSGGKPIK